MILHMRHTLWTGISETNVNIITSATRPHAFNNNNNNVNVIQPYMNLNKKLKTNYVIAGAANLCHKSATVARVFGVITYWPTCRSADVIPVALASARSTRCDRQAEV